MNELISYITINWAPLLILVTGLLMLGYFFYLNIYRKPEIISWIAKKMFSDRATNQSVGREMAENLSKKSAENLFMVVSSFLFTVGGLWVILAFYYLSY